MAGERILVVDDEPGVRSALEGILSDEGFRVSSAETGEAGLEAVERQTYDAVLLDVWLPGIDGLEALKRLRERRPDTEVVMISGHGTIDTAVRATKLGAFDFVEKPLSLEKTLLVLRNALRQRRLERSNRQLLEQLARDSEILGSSAASRRLRREIDIAAQVDSPVLIRGERGSGRETVARRIHAGRGAREPFVDVPCGALDAASIEATLYGTAEDPGRIGLAANGSLFLEDPDRLSAAAQARLAAELTRRAREQPGLKVLASVGSHSLGDALRQSLEVVAIDVPPLRKRREDVPLLAERFMNDLAREYGRAPKRLAPDASQALQAHDWPGNVRELKNLVQRLLLLVPAEVVGRADLPEALGGARAPAVDLYGEFESLADGVKAFERYYIARVLAEENEDRIAAARRLGLSGSTLQRRLKAMS